jgi:hypothetical protein
MLGQTAEIKPGKSGIVVAVVPPNTRPSMDMCDFSLAPQRKHRRRFEQHKRGYELAKLRMQALLVSVKIAKSDNKARALYRV